jgi:hypothetical protein
LERAEDGCIEFEPAKKRELMMTRAGRRLQMLVSRQTKA